MANWKVCGFPLNTNDTAVGTWTIGCSDDREPECSFSNCSLWCFCSDTRRKRHVVSMIHLLYCEGMGGCLPARNICLFCHADYIELASVLQEMGMLCWYGHGSLSRLDWQVKYVRSISMVGTSMSSCRILGRPSVLHRMWVALFVQTTMLPLAFFRADSLYAQETYFFRLVSQCTESSWHQASVAYWLVGEVSHETHNPYLCALSPQHWESCHCHM